MVGLYFLITRNYGGSKNLLYWIYINYRTSSIIDYLKVKLTILMTYLQIIRVFGRKIAILGEAYKTMNQIRSLNLINKQEFF
jgi:hypothetical protein